MRGKSSWFGFIRRTKSPELPVVLLEDSGALIGLNHRRRERLMINSVGAIVEGKVFRTQPKLYSPRLHARGALEPGLRDRCC